MNVLDQNQANGQTATVATPVASTTSPLSFSPGYVPEEDFELEARRLEATIGGYWGE